jgi:uncharacterized protein YutE (UPF0331/DUF86 family)
LVDPEVFERRLSRLQALVGDWRGVASVEAPRILTDRGLQAQAERWTHLAIECCLDLANHLIADRGWRPPESYKAAFDTLFRQGVIDAELAAQMAAWAGLRNILVHLYLEVDHERLHTILKTELDQLVAFAHAMQTELERKC